MATYNLKRFTDPEALKSIGPVYLVRFLNQFYDYMKERGFTLPEEEQAESFDYDALAHVFIAPDPETPSALVDALYYVHEMATPEGMNILLDEVDAKDSKLKLDCQPEPTPADVAVQVWLQNPELVERKHAEQQISRRRTFEYFQNQSDQIPELKLPTPKVLRAMEKDMDDWFEKKKRGRGSKTFYFVQNDEVWFMVRHGDPMKREGRHDEKEPGGCVYYRPERYDVIVYNKALGEIRINANTKGEKKLYCQQFGLHLFGDPEFFPGTGKYTLEPLMKNGKAALVCSDIEGVEWVKLEEIQYGFHGDNAEKVTRAADDLFESWKKLEKPPIPEKATLFRAKFAFKFADADKPRSVTIRPSNIAQCTRDEDALLVDEFLQAREFIVTDGEEGMNKTTVLNLEQEPEALVANA